MGWESGLWQPKWKVRTWGPCAVSAVAGHTLALPWSRLTTSTELKYKPDTKSRHFTPSEADPGAAQQEFCSDSLIPCHETPGNTPDLPHPDPQPVFLPCPGTLPAPLQGTSSSGISSTKTPVFVPGWSCPGFTSTCITSWECQTDLVWPCMEFTECVCSRGNSVIPCLFLSVRQATLPGNRCRQSTAKQDWKPQPIQELLFLFQCRNRWNLVLLGPFTSPQKCGNIPCSQD